MRLAVLAIGVLCCVLSAQAAMSVQDMFVSTVQRCATNFERRANTTRSGKTLEQWDSAVDEMHGKMEKALQAIFESVVPEDQDDRENAIAQLMEHEMSNVRQSAAALPNTDSFHSQLEREVYVMLKKAYSEWMNMNMYQAQLEGELGKLVEMMNSFTRGEFIFLFVEICASFNY